MLVNLFLSGISTFLFTITIKNNVTHLLPTVKKVINMVISPNGVPMMQLLIERNY